jgi:hypothetical protein
MMMRQSLKTAFSRVDRLTWRHEQTNGNLPGDFSQAPRCGAKNRRGTPCQCPAMPNGRCRLHGGLSTGAKTPEGIERIRQARLKHGWYTKRAKGMRAQRSTCLRSLRELIRALEATARKADAGVPHVRLSSVDSRGVWGPSGAAKALHCFGMSEPVTLPLNCPQCGRPVSGG